MRLRSAYDREIFRLAVLALGALAAEPLYVLVDTAIVGHLGRSQLAALGAAATVLSVLAMFNFLQYGTTAQVARATGPGRTASPGARRAGALALPRDRRRPRRAVAALAGPIVALVGVEGRRPTTRRPTCGSSRSAYRRSSSRSGQGFLRGSPT